jgi:molybdopterin synthase sulfur carrier subunit
MVAQLYWKGMGVAVLYFASVREAVGLPREDVDLPPEVRTVDEFLSWLRGRGESYERALSGAGIRVAVDRRHATVDKPVAGAREIAVFPMMTGG